MGHLKYGELEVSISPTHEALGSLAAEDFATTVNSELASRDEIAVILATGNSQLSFIRAVGERDDIDWSRITVLHMDEYLGMDEDHTASFRRWMRENLVERVNPKAFNGVRGDHLPVEEEIVRYSSLVRDLDPAVCVMGIGENGHLAFNDPPADFFDARSARVVKLDMVSRQQQVDEGHFTTFDEVPQQAITVTIPRLLNAADIIASVPGRAKRQAVINTLTMPISGQYPGTALRTHHHVSLYLDSESDPSSNPIV